MMDDKKLVEVLLFSSPEPLTQGKLNQILFDGENIDLKSTVELLNIDYTDESKGLKIEKIGGGYQLLSHPEYHLYIQRLFNKGKKVKLSRPALETLSIITYKQPMTRIEIESIRGVECGGVIKTLIERELVTIKGRDPGMGRALLYGTTQRFLELFGLNQLSDLPKLKEIDLLMSDGENPTEQIDEIE
jgi:segregation and condensation protein B